MENCPSNETKSGNRCFELNNEKYNSMACFYTAKIKESPFFSVKQAEYVYHGRKCRKNWRCVPIREEGNERERGYAGEAEPGVEQVGQPS